MKLNPYSFLYCSFYKFWGNKTKEIDRISFGVQSLIGVGLIVYFVILIIILKTNYNLSLNMKMNKHIFGITTTIAYYTLNYLIFDRNNRYKRLIEIYSRISIVEKTFHTFFWIIFLLTPFVLRFIAN